MEILLFILLFALLMTLEVVLKKANLQHIFASLTGQTPPSLHSDRSTTTAVSKEELKDMLQRVQTLEAIVTEPAYELNQKISQL